MCVCVDWKVGLSQIELSALFRVLLAICQNSPLHECFGGSLCMVESEVFITGSAAARFSGGAVAGGRGPTTD